MTEDPDGVYSGFMPVGVEGMCFISYDWDWEYTDGRSESFTYDGTHNAFRVIGKNAEGKVALHQFLPSNHLILQIQLLAQKL